MSESSVSRRAFMAATAGVGGVFLTAGWTDAAEAAERALARSAAGAPVRYKALAVADANDLIALTAQIFPSDGTPGAKEAGVVHFVDQSLAKNAKEMKAPIADLIAQVNGEAAKRFPGKGRVAALADADQHALVAWLEKEQPQRFGFLKGMSVAGMFAMPARGGNRNKAGWKLIGFKDQFSWQAPYGWYDVEGNK